MTYAPDDLLAIQRYARDKTGQSWASLGIIHSTPQGGGYHEGEDLLIQTGTAPGPQYPGSDYSYTDSPRDLASNGRLAGGNAASAFDFGGGFSRFLAFNAWMRQRMLAGDPRTRDIREMIHTLDGRTVRRIDRTGRQRDGGDSSHLSHTHFSFFRDSLGRRASSDNFLGLLQEFFEGKTPTTTSTGDDDMFTDSDRAMLGYISAFARMTHWMWSPDADGWQKAGGVPGEYAPLGGGSFVPKVTQMMADIAAVKQADSAQTAAITGLTSALNKALAGSGASIDAAPILAKIEEVRQSESAAVKALQGQIADLTAKLVKAEQASAAVLAGGATQS